MTAAFPTVRPDDSWGQWWRIHRHPGAWWFADDSGTDPGRFDLPLPDGTCYMACLPVGSAAEVLRTPGVGHPDAQLAANERLLSPMPLDRWHDKPIADFTDPSVVDHGAPADIAMVSREEARPWAVAARRAGFDGIRYLLREDPHRRYGLALFGTRGEHAPAVQPSSSRLPAGLRNELVELTGDYRGDPLAA
jgi:hypothetical protein